MKKTVYAFAPLIFLLLALLLNTLFKLWGFNHYEDPVFDGFIQICLIIAGAIGAAYGIKEKGVIGEVGKVFISNIKSVSGAIIILLLLGALSTAWVLGGVIPAMVYYGVGLFNPTWFLVFVCLICTVASVTIGSSWTTMACLGGAFMVIGQSMGFDTAQIAGAVISGAYFGDKLSPLSDTTNLASSITGVPLKTHIKYLWTTTIPTFTITLVVFALLSMSADVTIVPVSEQVELRKALNDTFFTLSPYLLIIPLGMFLLFLTRLPPWVILLVGIASGILVSALQSSQGYLQVITSTLMLWSGPGIKTPNVLANEVLSDGGISGNLMIVFLVISAMFFAACLKASGSLQHMLDAILTKRTTTFGLVIRTVLSCLGLNLATGDQYISVVLPAQSYSLAFAQKGLPQKLLSRTVEDSGSVTSVLFPHNSCGAFAATALNVSVLSYLPFAVFCYISPLMTLLFVALGWQKLYLQQDVNERT